MSAFLGPIHHWLYHKINLQEGLTRSLLNAFPEQKDSVLADLDAVCGTPAQGDLAAIIDGSNIHGWLQGQVTVVEDRLARAAGQLAEDRQALLDAAFAAGTETPLTAASAQEAYQALQDVLLDGMPCDMVNALRDQSEHAVRWERVRDLHSHFWIENGADPLLFDEIRTAWVSGMLQGSGIAYVQDGSMFCLREEA